MQVKVYVATESNQMLEVEIDGGICNAAIYLDETIPFESVESDGYSIFYHGDRGPFSYEEYANEEEGAKVSVTQVASFEVQTKKEIKDKVKELLPEYFI